MGGLEDTPAGLHLLLLTKKGENMGLIRIRVLFEGGSILRIYGDQNLTNRFQKLINSVQWKGLIFDF